VNHITKAIFLLEDDNLVWSNDFEQIRIDLAGLLKKATQVEYHHLEPEVDDLAIKLVKEGATHARRTETDTTQD